MGLLGCSGGSEAAVTEPDAAQASDQGDKQVWPEGAVLAVDKVPILQTEVDRVAAWVQLLHPENTQPSLRRQALTHILLNRATVANLFPVERAAARAKCEEAATKLGPKGDTTTQFQELSGSWADLTLERWGETRDLEVGILSAPIELVGRWTLIRLDSIVPGAVPAADRFAISYIDYPFVPSSFDTEALLNAQSEVTIIDPSWENLVPSAWGKTLPEGWYAGPK